MESDKDNTSLGQNTSPDPTTSPVDVVPVTSPTANNAIFSSSDLPTATPLNSPLPTDPLHPIQTVGSGKGDVRVGETHKSKKKPLIIAAIILAVVTFVGLITLAIVSSSNKNHDTSMLSPEVAFNQYANYLLFGEKKDEAPAGEFDLDTTYELDRQLSSEVIDETYWGTARDLLSAAITSYHDTENPTNPHMNTVFDDYQKTFNFVDRYRQVGDFDESRIITAYTDSNPDAIKTEISDFYKKFSELDSEIAKDYAAQRIAQYSAMLDLYSLYNSLGCLENGEVNETTCATVSDPARSEEFTTLSTTISHSNARAKQILSQSTQSLEDGCWRLGAQLQEAPQPEDTEEENA